MIFTAQVDDRAAVQVWPPGERFDSGPHDVRLANLDRSATVFLVDDPAKEPSEGFPISAGTSWSGTMWSERHWLVTDEESAVSVAVSAMSLR